VSRNAWLAVGVVLGSLVAALVAWTFREREDEPTAAAPALHEAPAEAPAAQGASESPDIAARGLDAPPPSSSAQAPVRATTSDPTAIAPDRLDEPPPPMAEDPFASENSREIDYAFELAVGPNSSVESARAAAEVFQRCLEAAPGNHRCYRGLVAAQERQRPDWTPPPPTAPLAPGAMQPGPAPLRPGPLEAPPGLLRGAPGRAHPVDDPRPGSVRRNPTPPAGRGE
jgi:hypothetical protein